MSSPAYRAAHREEIRAANADRIRIGGGERINIRTLPPEWRAIALLIRETHKALKLYKTAPGARVAPVSDRETSR